MSVGTRYSVATFDEKMLMVVPSLEFQRMISSLQSPKMSASKLGVDFDYTEIIQTNKKDEADYYRQLLVNGILSINEVRSKMGYTPVEEDYADKHWIQISYAAADAIAEGAYIRPQDQGQNQKVDNKVKSDEE